MIRELREKRGWTQTELARRAGIKQGVLSDIETGTTKDPRVGTLSAIANALEVPIEELIRKEEREC